MCTNTPAEILNIFHFSYILSEKTGNGSPDSRFLKSLLGVHSSKDISGYNTNPKNSIILASMKFFSTVSAYAEINEHGDYVIPYLLVDMLSLKITNSERHRSVIPFVVQKMYNQRYERNTFHSSISKHQS